MAAATLPPIRAAACASVLLRLGCGGEPERGQSLGGEGAQPTSGYSGAEQIRIQSKRLPDRQPVPVLQEPDIRLVGDTRPTHCHPQIVGVDEEPCPVQVIPAQQDQHLPRVIGTAKQAATLGAAGPARHLVLVKERLPDFVVRHPVANEQGGHGRLLPPRGRSAPSALTSFGLNDMGKSLAGLSVQVRHWVRGEY